MSASIASAAYDPSTGYNPAQVNPTYTSYSNPPTQSFASPNPKAFCSGATCTYIPLEPFSNDRHKDPYATAGYGGSGGKLSDYLGVAFKILITLGSLFAVVMLVVAGIGYMVAEAAIDIERAKERARASLWGLLLLVGCWLILYAINPNLLNFTLTIPGSPPGTQTSSSAPPSTSWPTQAEQSDCTQKLGSIKFNPGGGWTCVYQGMY